MLQDTIFKNRTSANPRIPTMPIHRWGALACFLLPVAFVFSRLIYLMGNLRDPSGPFTYALADFFYGPVWSVSLVVAVFALREHIGKGAAQRMSLSLSTALLAAGMMVIIACIRSANRNYHIMHPDLHLEMSTPVLVVWTTLVAGLTGAGWHFLGWSLLLLGSAGWTTQRLPRLLSVLYLLAGGASLFFYLLSDEELGPVLFVMVVSIWQGILLWKAEPDENQTSDINEGMATTSF